MESREYKPIYLIPGIGADYRIYSKIDLPGYDVHHVAWVKPLKDETIENYAKRISTQVKHEAPVFIGLSFGGLIAAEFHKLFPGSKFILISTIASRHELPWYAKFGAAIGLNHWIHKRWFKKPNPMIRWIFSVRDGDTRKLFDAILADADADFLVWAFDELLHWKGNGHARLHHIHGNKDRLIPVRNVSADIIVNGGSHMMIVDEGRRISETLVRILHANAF